MKHLLILSLIVLVGASTQPIYADWNPFKKNKKVDNKIAVTIAQFQKKDPDLKSFFDQAFGYAIFPTVGKGGIGIGGAYGKGEVYQKGKLIGTTWLKQISIGFQFGGQSYSEIIFFKDKISP